MEKKVLIKALKNALSMEKRGYEFYKEAAGKSENDITKKTFNFLADNEVMHIESIRKFYESLTETDKLSAISLKRDKRKRDLSIFSKNISELEEKVKKSDTDKKACEFAMEFENNGYKYYKDMLEGAKDENLIKFLKFLLDEESKHYETIEKLHTYLTDSHNWFMYEEGSFPQG